MATVSRSPPKAPEDDFARLSIDRGGAKLGHDIAVSGRVPAPVRRAARNPRVRSGAPGS